MTALIPIVLIAIWLAVAVIDAGFLPGAHRWFRKPGNPVRFITWLVALGFVALTLLCPADSLLGSLRTEAISTAIAVIVLNELGMIRAAAQEKRIIIEQMGSHANDAALEAVRLARKHGWLEDGSLADVELSGANLKDVDLSKARLEGANLNGAHLDGASLYHAHLDGANLRSADMEGVNLSSAYMKGANLKGANLKGAHLAFVHLEDGDLNGTHLEGANLWFAHLEGANLYFAHLEDACLLYATLEGASLTSAQLAGANLNGAQLYGTDLYNICLKDATYTRKTSWPDGFDPVVAGARLVDRLYQTDAESPA